MRLGAGGMGEVWRARDPRLGRDLAVKILPAGLGSDRGRLKRFEPLEGKTLGSCLSKGPVPPKRAVDSAA